MSIYDYTYLTIIATGLLLDRFLVWPGFLQRSSADEARARLWLWSYWMIILWGLTATGVLLWIFMERSWIMLGLILPRGWHLMAAICLLLLSLINSINTVTKIMRTKKRLKIKGHNEKMAPHTNTELGWYMALSVSAGFCEEFIFRGYLIWAFQPILGLWGSAFLSVVIFALAHSYQGMKGILVTGLVGLLFTIAVVIFKSIWPAILLHAMVDMGDGLAAWLVLRKLSEQEA